MILTKDRFEHKRRAVGFRVRSNAGVEEMGHVSILHGGRRVGEVVHDLVLQLGVQHDQVGALRAALRVRIVPLERLPGNPVTAAHVLEVCVTCKVDQ